MTYEQRYQREWQSFMDCGGEGSFHPPRRTPAEIAERTVTIEDEIACELLRRDRNAIGTYPWAEVAVKQVYSDRNYATPFNAGIIDQLESMRDWQAGANGIARVLLADAIVAHRLTSPGSGETRTVNLGFGVTVTTSLAAAIVEYHNRIRFLMSK